MVLRFFSIQLFMNTKHQTFTDVLSRLQVRLIIYLNLD